MVTAHYLLDGIEASGSDSVPSGQTSLGTGAQMNILLIVSLAAIGLCIVILVGVDQVLMRRR